MQMKTKTRSKKRNLVWLVIKLPAFFVNEGLKRRNAYVPHDADTFNISLEVDFI